MIIRLNGGNIVLTHDGDGKSLSKAIVSRKKTGRWVIAVISRHRSRDCYDTRNNDEYDAYAKSPDPMEYPG